MIVVTDGIESAIKQAKAAADGKVVNLLGANVARQVMAAGLLDEFHVHIAPFFLGDGIRLYNSPGSQQVQFERISVVGSLVHPVEVLWMDSYEVQIEKFAK